MKTAKFTAALSTFIIVLFMSYTSIANSTAFYTGDILNVYVKNLVSYATPENEFSYLRFDVNKYAVENEVMEVNNNSLDYLRFDVNNFVVENENAVTELPSAGEFGYLRFNLTNFIDGTKTEITELPSVNNFDYLRFDVNKFVEINTADISEMPVNEFDYLHFDVNSFVAGNTIIDELPVKE